MQVSAALLDREPEQLVERAHDRRAAREIAQIVEIVINDSGRVGCRWLFRCSRFDRGRKRSVNIVSGSDRDRDLPLQRDLGGADCLVLDRACDGKRQRAGAILIRKNPFLLEKTRRQPLAREAAADQVCVLDAPAAIEGGKLIREGGMREPGHAEPVDIAERIAPSRRHAGVELLRVAQRALADEITDEVALRHVRSHDRDAGLGLVRGNKADLRGY